MIEINTNGSKSHVLQVINLRVEPTSIEIGNATCWSICLSCVLMCAFIVLAWHFDVLCAGYLENYSLAESQECTKSQRSWRGWSYLVCSQTTLSAFGYIANLIDQPELFLSVAFLHQICLGYIAKTIIWLSCIVCIEFINFFWKCSVLSLLVLEWSQVGILCTW